MATHELRRESQDGATSTSPVAAREYLFGFDYLRAAFSICVVAIHIRYVFPSKIFDSERWQEHVFVWSDFLNFYVLLLAVPVFYTMSCFLEARSSRATPWRKMGRALRLLVFWGVLLNVYRFGGDGTFYRVPADPLSFLEFIASGFRTPYYFFASLAIVLGLSCWARQASTRTVGVLLGASLLLLGAAPVLAVEFASSKLAVHWLPLNFLPYPFAAVLCQRMGLTRARATAQLFLLIGGLLAILDWTVYVDPIFFEVNRFAIPAYTRPSLVFLATGVVLLSMLVTVQAGPVVRFMSKHSLALYCLHPFALWLAPKVTKAVGLVGFPELIAQLSLVVALCYAVSVRLLPAFLKEELYR